MHELSLAENIKRIILEKAHEAGAGKITGVTVKLGALSGVEPTALEFAFNCVVKDTIASEARLFFERVETRLKCLLCGGDFPIREGIFECPFCTGREVQIVAGEEFYVESIDIE